jgi:hypothetical protein
MRQGLALISLMSGKPGEVHSDPIFTSESAGGGVILVPEGGYSLGVLARSVEAHDMVLLK